MLLFTLGAALLTGLIFGLAPAIQTARQNVNESLGKGGRGGGSGVSGRLRNVLVVSEVALALVLLAGAGLMIRSMTSLLSISPGFRTDHLLTMHVNLTAPKYQDEKRAKAFGDELLDRVARVPGVQSVAIGSGFPMLDRISATPFRVKGNPRPATEPARSPTRRRWATDISKRSACPFFADDPSPVPTRSKQTIRHRGERSSGQAHLAPGHAIGKVLLLGGRP